MKLRIIHTVDDYYQVQKYLFLGIWYDIHIEHACEATAHRYAKRVIERNNEGQKVIKVYTSQRNLES